MAIPVKVCALLQKKIFSLSAPFPLEFPITIHGLSLRTGSIKQGKRGEKGKKFQANEEGYYCRLA